MKTIDLVSIADRSKKIPAKLLSPSIKKLPQSWRLLTAHLIDFHLILMIGALTFSICSQSIRIFLVTRPLAAAYSEHEILSYSISFLPLLTLTYFFFSYFMNHGQTIGMGFLESRIQMKDKSFYEALKWAMNSLIVCYSLGLSYLLTKNSWKNFKWKDYLYQDLINHQDVPGINLLLQTHSPTQVISSDEFEKKAA